MQDHLVRQNANGIIRRCITGYLFEIKICDKCFLYQSLKNKLINGEIDYKDISSYINPNSDIKILQYLNKNKIIDYLILCSNHRCENGEIFDVIEPCNYTNCPYHKDKNSME